MKKLNSLLFFLLCFTLLNGQEDKKVELINYLNNNWKTPEEYVINKFETYDYIFIGEGHRVKHDVEFINNLIPILFKNHIYIVGIEFGAYECQYLVDSLINSPIFDRKLADSIYFRTYPVWGYKEYIDLYKTVWEVNHSSVSDTNKFRIVNLCCKYDPCAKDHFNGNNPDKFMADVIFNEIVNKKQKSLIYSGVHHGFTKYHQPIYDFKKDSLIGFTKKRMGNLIYDSLKNKTFNIFLHCGWVSKNSFDSVVKPVNGVIDSIMSNFINKRVGFDAINSPFGKLTSIDSYYALGYPNFSLENFCDGYIYQNDFKNFMPITMENDFITKKNISSLKEFLKCVGWSESELNKLTVKNANKELFVDIREIYQNLIK